MRRRFGIDTLKTRLRRETDKRFATEPKAILSYRCPANGMLFEMVGPIGRYTDEEFNKVRDAYEARLDLHRMHCAVCSPTKLEVVK